MDFTISCIVPVFNEAKRVEKVSTVLVGHPLIDEVIVINDGSSDNSEQLLQKIKGIKLISYQKNQGKTLAMKRGFQSAKNELIMTIDSDLVGLSKKAVGELIEPVRNGLADISISLRSNSLLLFKLLGLDFVSGERVFHKKLLGDLEKLTSLPPFGLESYMNQLIVEKQLRIRVVPWKTVISPRKSKKFGCLTGLLGDIKMVSQIISLLKPWGVLRQIWQMRKLRV
ncbi:MAG: glycosyltransferase [bacterium]|nr:glycosyltransferase [bacterium]